MEAILNFGCFSNSPFWEVELCNSTTFYQTHYLNRSHYLLRLHLSNFKPTPSKKSLILAIKSEEKNQHISNHQTSKTQYQIKMLAAQTPFSGDRISHRKPLQPINQSVQPNNQLAATMNLVQPKPCMEISILDTSNKENVPPYQPTPVKKARSQAETIDPSLADELNAIREKLERLRSEELRTEKVLRERGLVLDMEMKEILNRGEMQKQLELEVDRLYRLKEIKLTCMRISRLRSLRGKEEERKMKQDQLNKAYVYTQARDSLHSESVSEEIN